MTGQQLRNSILQEAIHGRLVPNALQPGEHTARELLDDILAARQKAENEAKGKKAKKLTISKIDEEPWELPEGWCWCRVKDLCELSDATKTSGNFINMDAAFLRGKNNGTPISKGRFVPKGSRMILVDGENSGEVFIAPCDGYLGSTFKQLLIYNEGCALYLLQFLLFNKALFRNNKKGAAIPHLNKEVFRELEFPLPPLSIQRSIVSKIETLLPLVEAYDAAQGELRALNESLPDKLRKSVLQEAIHGRLVPNTLQPGELTARELLDDILAARQKAENEAKGKKAKKLTLNKIEEEPWELPEGWCWCRLGDVMTFVNGRAYKKEELLSQGKYKVLRVGNFFTNESWYYSDLELPEDKYCYKGDLLYAWSASFGPQIWEGDKTIFHYHIWNVRFNEDYLYKKYLYWFFEADKHIIKESTTGSTMVHVSMENMMPRFLPLPPLSIQHEIVSKIEEIFAVLDSF